MATPTTSSPAITRALDILSKISFESTTDKQYQTLHRYINVTSYSILNELHACPRAYQLIKSNRMPAAATSNIDFAFGHAVGAGAQNFLHTRDLDIALYNCFLAWRLPFDAAYDKKKKSLWEASLAVMKFPQFAELALEEWKVLTLPSGKAALELSIEVVCPNNYKHYIHIDAVMQHRRTGQLAVFECKTTGMREVEEAYYANSNQALGYAVLVDALSPNTSYEVLYSVYSASTREWELLPFTKDAAARAEWALDLRLDHAAISTYRELGFFPKRGESCVRFGRRCQFFGECNMTNTLPELLELPAEEQAEKADFSFTLEQVLEAQRSRL